MIRIIVFVVNIIIWGWWTVFSAYMTIYERQYWHIFMFFIFLGLFLGNIHQFKKEATKK